MTFYAAQRFTTGVAILGNLATSVLACAPSKSAEAQAQGGTSVASTQGGVPNSGGSAAVTGGGGGKPNETAKGGSGGEKPAGGAAGSVGDEVPFVYVGSGFYDVPQAKLHAFRLDPETGELAEVATDDVDAYPSFIAVAPDKKHLYVNVENTPGSAIAYAIDSASGRLTRMNTAPSGGDGAAYISTDPSGKFVMQVNYDSGSVVVHGTQADGSLGTIVDQHDLGGSAAYPHAVLVEPTGHFAFVTSRWDPNAPGNHIAQFELDAITGALTPNEPAKVELPFGFGPRHIAFHPNAKFAYVDNERNSTVSAYSFDSAAGSLQKMQDVSTLPDGFEGSNAPADMRIHPSGKFLYVANRGQYSVALFGIDQTSGALTALGHETFDGQPRNLFVDPNGHFLVVGDLRGNKVRIYRIDEATGALSAIGKPAPVTSPSGLAVVYLSALPGSGSL